MHLLTTSSHKIAEYLSLGIEAKRSDPFREVKGSLDEVVIYKVLQVPANILVEDTILRLDGEDIVESKYTLPPINVATDASWITSLGFHDGEQLYIYRGELSGRLNGPIPESTKSLATFFVPNGAERTLQDLRDDGLGLQYSARRAAVDAFRESRPALVKLISEVPQWTGPFQDSDSIHH